MISLSCAVKILFFSFKCEDIDVVMVTEKYDSSFNITIEVEFDLLLRRKRALFLPFVKLVNRINLTIFDHSPDLD